jgi:hypothetical protein
LHFTFLLLENFWQVLVADINIGYEDIVNTQVKNHSLVTGAFYFCRWVGITCLLFPLFFWWTTSLFWCHLFCIYAGCCFQW